MQHLLYHCFSRTGRHDFDVSLAVLEGILRDGILLSREELDFKWADPEGSVTIPRVRQYRFCLTSLNNKTDLKDHCNAFGPIGIGFKTEVVRALGGFPVFYLPAPVELGVACAEDSLGVSLVYRLSELRGLLDKVKTLPSRVKDELYTNVADSEELEGALRFLGNILYFTDYTRQDDIESLRYYNQREWRIIAGLSNEIGAVEFSTSLKQYVIKSYQGDHIRHHIDTIVVSGTNEHKLRISALLNQFSMSREILVLS